MKKIIQVSIAAALIAATGSAAAWWDGPGWGQNRGWRSTHDGDDYGGDWSYGMSSGIHNPYRRNNRYNYYNRIDPNNPYNRIDPYNIPILGPNGARYGW